MKLPDWLKWRHAKTQEPGSLTVELSLETRAFTEAMETLARRAESMATALEPFSRAAHQMLERSARRREVRVAGLEARWYVRGALIQGRSQAQVDAVTRYLLGSRFPGLTDQEKVRVATAFIAGTIGAWSAA